MLCCVEQNPTFIYMEKHIYYEIELHAIEPKAGVSKAIYCILLLPITRCIQQKRESIMRMISSHLLSSSADLRHSFCLILFLFT